MRALVSIAMYLLAVLIIALLASCAVDGLKTESSKPAVIERTEYVFVEPTPPEFSIPEYVAQPCVGIAPALPDWRRPTVTELRRENQRVRAALRNCTDRQDATRNALLYILGELRDD